MNDDEAVLAEAARVLDVESKLVEIELVLRAVLPDLIGGVVSAVARRFDNEIIGLHNRIDRLER